MVQCPLCGMNLIISLKQNCKSTRQALKSLLEHHQQELYHNGQELWYPYFLSEQQQSLLSLDDDNNDFLALSEMMRFYVHIILKRGWKQAVLGNHFDIIDPNTFDTKTNILDILSTLLCFC